jgi:hypothetical protein
MTLTEMIVHGHGDKNFIQYCDELWPNDTNFMIFWIWTPKRILLRNLARTFLLFECIEACGQNCRCEAIAKETTLDGQLCEK